MEGTPKAIEMKGIVRNATVIGVQDGQAEDLINLRFMDGAWRASGNGRVIENFTLGHGGVLQYTQLYVHTNVYRHLLGVRDGQLWWFADIEDDGVTFTPLDTPVALTQVADGDILITQTGHLLTVIDANDDFEFFLYKTDTKRYIYVDMDVNGKSPDRTIFPFGQVHFNYYSDASILLRDIKNATGGQYEVFTANEQRNLKTHRHISFRTFSEVDDTIETIKNIYIAEQGELRGINVFTGAMLACAAVRLYDGSYVYASNPVLICPRQKSHYKDIFYTKENGKYVIKPFTEWSQYDYENQRNPFTEADSGVTREILYEYESLGGDAHTADAYPWMRQRLIRGNFRIGDEDHGVFKVHEDCLPPILSVVESLEGFVKHQYLVTLGYDLTFSIEDINTLIKNKDVFTHLCIFVTPEVEMTRVHEEGELYRLPLQSSPTTKEIENRIHDLMHNPMFLLKEYRVEDLVNVKDDIIIDLTKKEDEGLLEHDNIVQRNQLPIEAFVRTTYIPKTSYLYNGRLHIANYKSFPFYGYPLDLFNLHNHSVKVQDRAWFPADEDGKRVLPNLTSNFDELQQYDKGQVDIRHIQEMEDDNAPFFIVKVYVESDQVENQVVCRYIPAYDPSPAVNGRADFIEDLNPLLCFPDIRAKKMEIYYIDQYYDEEEVHTIPEDPDVTDPPLPIIGTITIKPGWHVRRGVFNLKPHPYLNIAYYIDPEMRPIKLADFQNYPLEVHVEEQEQQNE